MIVIIQQKDIGSIVTSGLAIVTEKRKKLDEQKYVNDPPRFVDVNTPSSEESKHNNELREKYDLVESVFQNLSNLQTKLGNVFVNPASDYSQTMKEVKAFVGEQVKRLDSI